MQSKTLAQQRVDQIHAFQSELQQLQHEQVVELSEAQQCQINDYHTDLIQQLKQSFDVDVNRQAKQLSLGMKIASFLGALALAASLFFLFRKFWGSFSTPAQVSILILAPLLTLLATFYTAQKEQTGYFSKILGLVSFTCLLLNISMMGAMFNITPSENACLILALYGLLLAYAADIRLLLAAGILSLAAFLSAKTATWAGIYWLHAGERPEHFFAAALLLFWIPVIPNPKHAEFGPIYRVFALLFLFVPLLILANWGRGSYLPFANDSIEILYQILGFLLSAGVIILGIRQHWSEVVNTGNIFFTLLLYTKFYDWWWNWMPKYLFFLLVALAAILMLLIFKRLRETEAMA